MKFPAGGLNVVAKAFVHVVHVCDNGKEDCYVTVEEDAVIEEWNGSRWVDITPESEKGWMFKHWARAGDKGMPMFDLAKRVKPIGLGTHDILVGDLANITVVVKPLTLPTGPVPAAFRRMRVHQRVQIRDGSQQGPVILRNTTAFMIGVAPSGDLIDTTPAWIRERDTLSPDIFWGDRLK